MILIVDDHEDSRQFLAKLLTRQGYMVRTASGGREALECVQTGVPRLFILDENMPGMSGMELLIELRSDVATAHARVIFLSGTFERDIAKRALDLGASEWLVKGVHGPTHMLAAVARAFATV